MAFSARRRLATSLSHHFSRRLHPSFSHLLPPHHDRSESCSPSSAAPPPPQSQPAPPFPSALLRPSRSRPLTSLPLPFALHLAAHRNFSTTSSSSTPDIDAAADVLSDAASSIPVSELLSDEAASAAASIPLPPAPYAGEVAAAAAESFPPVAALQHLLDAVQSFTGLNWWVTIALTTVLIRSLTIPLLINQMKSTYKLNDMRPAIEAINEEMRNSTDPRSMEVGKQKLGELFLKHDVTPLTPFKGLFIQGPIFMSFFFAISNMVEKVPSLKGGGAYWFTDLTTPDEFIILPVLTSLTFLAIVELNMQDGMEGNPMAESIKKLSRFFGVMFVPLTLGFPKAFFFYWITSNLFSLVYGVVIRNPAVRMCLDLPPLQSQPTPMQAINLFDGPKPSPGVDSPIADKACEQSSSELSEQSSSELSEQSISERSEPSSSERSEASSSERTEASSSERSEQCSSELSDGIRDLEDRAKSRGESQQ